MTDVKIVYQSDLEQSLRLATEETRNRKAILLNESFSEVPQRFINNLTRDTYVRPHKHVLPQQWELMSWMTGEVEALLFTEEGILYDRYTLAGDQVKLIEFKPGLIHSFLTNSSGSYLEVRNCAYEPTIDRVYMSWSPEEGSIGAQAFLEKLRVLKLGDNIKDYFECTVTEIS